MSKVICKCYGKDFEFNNTQDAMLFFTDCMANSSGSEQSRYTSIFLQLSSGNTVCTDEYCV